MDFWFFADWRMVVSVGLPLIFIPIIAASYDGLPPGKTDMASALLNAARNTGGSIGVSLASNVLAHRHSSAPRSRPGIDGTQEDLNDEGAGSRSKKENSCQRLAR